jgi:hypothetical protein
MFAAGYSKEEGVEERVNIMPKHLMTATWLG